MPTRSPRQAARRAGAMGAGDIRVNGPAISRFRPCGCATSFCHLIFCMHGENYNGLFLQTIILALIMIGLID
jgi:hypothetical protein